MKRTWCILLLLLFFNQLMASSSVVITEPVDLCGGEMILPYKTDIVFKDQGCVYNGRILGNGGRIIVRNQKPVFDNIKLSGNFSNNKSYLSWWNCKEDITDEILSLVSCFEGKVFIDIPGKLSSSVNVKGRDRFVLDGCGNTITIDNVAGAAINIVEVSDLEIKSIIFKYAGCDFGNEKNVQAIRIEHGNINSSVVVDNITISDFDNHLFAPCGFDALLVENCHNNTSTLIRNIVIKDIRVKGDGRELNGIGANYGITITCHKSYSGKVRINNCKLDNICNVDKTGKYVYEDASGIYLAGAVGYDSLGEMTYANWNAKISNCQFRDVSKRNVKIQGNNVFLANLTSETTDSFLKSEENMYVGINGNNIRIKHIYGQYDGAIVKITGDYLTLKDMHCTSSLRESDHAHVIRLEGTLHATIEDCFFDNNTYIFLFPKENGFTSKTVPEYHINKCDLNIKHLIYCISGYQIIYYKGKLFVNNSKLKLSDTFCFNSQSLAAIVLTNTFVECSDSLYHKKEDGTPIITMKKAIIKKCLN